MVFAPFALFLFIFCIYLFGNAHVVFGGDSGDIILSYFFGGVAHPPGYPLNTFLGFVLTRIIPFGSFAYRANLVSTFYMAFGIGLLWVFLFRTGKNYLVALAASLVLAFVPLFWLYAHIAEVFQLSVILILASLIFLFEFWSHKERQQKKYLYLSFFFLGLAVFHHQTSLLLAPAYLFALLKLRVIKAGNLRETFKLLSVFALGFIPYIYVFWAASIKTPINWDDPSTFGGFWNLISRADYGTFTAAPDLVGFSPIARLVQVLWYLKVVLADFTYFGAGLILLGTAWLFIRDRARFWFFALCAIFTGPFFLAYASFPPLNSLLLGISERFLLVNYLFLATFVFFGMGAVVDILTWISGKFYKNKRKFFQLLISVSFFGFPFFLVLNNWSKTDLSDSTIGDVVGRDILLSAEPPGIIFLQGDTLTFNTQYSYYVDKINTASVILMTGRLKHASYRKQIKRFYPNLFYPDNFLSDSNLPYSDTVVGLMNSNFSTLPIYSFSALDVPKGYLWVQQGMLKRLYKSDDLPESSEIKDKVFGGILRMNFKADLVEGHYLNFFDENIKATYGGVFTDNAFELLRHDAIDESKDYFDMALKLSPENQLARFGLGVFYFEKKDCQQAKNLFEEIVNANSSLWQAWEGLGQVYKTCFGDEAKAKEFLDRSLKERKGEIDEPVEEL